MGTTTNDDSAEIMANVLSGNTEQSWSFSENKTIGMECTLLPRRILIP